ncbi:MAG: DUF6599 family protein [Candidatus Zixiibacteriota bacterium]
MSKSLIHSAAVVCLVGLILTVPSCGKKEKRESQAQEGTFGSATKAFFSAKQLLPKAPYSENIKPKGTIKKVLPKDADSLLKERGKQYLRYDFSGLISSEYEVNNVPVYVEIAQFGTLEDAYGFYASLRPDGIITTPLGAESFLLDTQRYFTRGEYVVTLTVEKGDSSHLAAQTFLAQQINSRITGSANPPPFFMLFPSANKIVPSNKYYRGNFLNVSGLDKVYATSYLFEGDTAVFFLTMDESGEKFLRLKEFADSTGRVSQAPDTFIFDNSYSISFTHPTKGSIVAGLVRQKLVGIIGYDSTKNDRLASTWVQGLR